MSRVALFMFACAALLAAAAPLVKHIASPWKELTLGALLSALGFLLTALFVLWDRRSVTLGLAEVGAWTQRSKWQQTATRFGAGCAIGLALVALSTAALAAVGSVRFELASKPRVVEWGAALLGYLLLASREELAFRGYPLFRLRKVVGDWPALIVIALMFAAEHRLGGWDWGRALYGAGLGSLIFGLAALATRGLAFPIGLHAAWNCGQWAAGFRADGAPVKAIVLPQDQTRFDVVNSASYVILMAALGLALLIWKRRQSGEVATMPPVPG
ncbi:MAG: lysostaphin resistance A-like protein [Phycisphaerales bacterium]